MCYKIIQIVAHQLNKALVKPIEKHVDKTSLYWSA